MTYHLNRNIKPLSVSVCIPAYNEEMTIAHVLKRVLNNVTNLTDDHFTFKDIIVVSESVDKTNEIVEGFIKLNPRVRLILSHKRLGLSGAISIAIKNAKSNIIVIVDADVFLKPYSISALIQPFNSNINVYATSGRKIPISNCAIVHTFWSIHHELCLIYPKLCSSIMAFRTEMVNGIPQFFGTPDTYLMSLLEKRGLKVVYVPDAKGETLEPNDLRGFIAQRKRIYIQHLFLKKCLGYNPPAFKFRLYIIALIKAMLNDRMYRALNYLACALIELYSRLIGLFVYRKEWRKSHFWEKVR